MAHRGQPEQPEAGAGPGTSTSRGTRHRGHGDTEASILVKTKARTNRAGQGGRKGGAGVTETSSRTWDGQKQVGGQFPRGRVLEGWRLRETRPEA